jgi:gamma-F420-2:alpha-L-glutamate ligase
MLGWILYKPSSELLKQEDYEILRFQEAAVKFDIDLQVLNPEQIELIVTREGRKSILVDNQPTALPDFVLPRMGAFTNYFTLAVIRHLERLGVYPVNSSQAIDTVKDKLYTLQILAEHDFPIPKTILAKFPVDTMVIEDQLKFPVIVKTLSGSQGSGVFLSTDKNSFEDLMLLISAANKNVNIILQEFVKKSKGRDLRVFTVGGRTIAAMERKATDGSFKANFSRGGKVKRYPINDELEWLSLEISRILNLDIAGIDFLFDKDGFKICEVNSSPGFKGIESCCEVNVAEEVFKFIRVRLGGRAR